jgi:hypothetical protein
MSNVSSLPEREPWNGKNPVDMCVEGMEDCNLEEKSYLHLYTSDAADLYSVLQCIEKDPTAIARVDECVRLYQSKIAPDKKTRQSHFRSKAYLTTHILISSVSNFILLPYFLQDLWETGWGQMLLDPKLLEPASWQHRNFVRRFRLPFQLFKQLVAECVEVNLFQQQR